MKQKLFRIFCCLLLSASMVTQAQLLDAVNDSPEGGYLFDDNGQVSGRHNAPQAYNFSFPTFGGWSDYDTYNSKRSALYKWHTGASGTNPCIGLVVCFNNSNGVSYGTRVYPPKGNYTFGTSYSTGYVFTYRVYVTSASGYKYSYWKNSSGTMFYPASGTVTFGEGGGETPYVTCNSMGVENGSGQNVGSVSFEAGVAPTYRTVSVTSDNTTMGTVSSAYKSGYFYTPTQNWKEGSTWTLTASPKSGYRFVCWKKNGSQISTSATTDVTIDGNATYTAYFEQDAATKYNITTNVNNNSWGSVTPGGEKAENTNFTITATATSLAYGFVKWQKNGADFSGNTVNPITVTVTADATYTAVFEHLPQGVITVVSNYGTVTGAGSYERGTNVTLEAFPNSGYSFAQWSDGNTDNPRTITVTGNATYTAQYYDLNQPLLASFSWDDDDIGVESYGDGDNLCNSFYSPAGKPFKLLYAKSNSRNSKNYLQLSIQSSQSQMWGEVSWAKTGSYPVLSSGLTTGSCGYGTYWYWTLSQTNVCVAYGYDSYDLGLNILGSYLCDKSGNADDTSDQSNYISVTEGITCVIEEGAGGNPYIRLVRDADGQCLVSVGEAPCRYQVAFNANGGSGTMTNQEFTCGEAQPLNPNAFTGPAATITYNYHGATSGNGTPSVTVNKPFGVWEGPDEDVDDEAEVNFSASNGGTITLIATWNAFPSVTLPTPARTGYTFNGWYTEETGGTKKGNGGASFNPAGNINLHAQWTANTHNVSWVTDGNALTGTYTNGTTAYGTTIVAPETPTKTATAQYTYTFNGWTPAVAATMPDNDVTYTATWTETPVNYTLTWTTDGDALTGTYTSGTVAYGTTIVAPATPTKTGYTFAGWNVTPASTMPAANTTYTAQWTANTHNVSWVTDGNALTGTYTNGTTAYGTTIVAPATPTKNATAQYTYTFNGWTPAVAATMPDNDVTYTATWTETPVNYTLTWTTDGDALTGTYTSGTVAYGTTIVAPANPTKTGYTFAGWDVTPASTMPAANTTYTAQWTVVTYNLTYEGLEDATNTNPATYTIESETITLADPGARDGYAFTGWTINGTPVTEITHGSTGDKTLTANWNAKLTAIRLEDNRENRFYDIFKTTYNGETGVVVTYERTFAEGRWSTLCLPFDVNSTMFSSLNFGSRIYEFKYATGNANDDSGVNLYFSIAKSIKAGKGYIVNADNALSKRNEFVFPGVKINLSADKGDTLGSVTAYNALDGSGATQGNIELVGTLRKGTLAVQEGEKVNTYMGLKGNKIYYPNITSGSTILAYRGIFRSIDREPLNAERIRIIVDGEEKAELEVINGELQDVQETKKFIENGVLYIERNGIIYDATGRKVE